jgi:long-subunit fatty acid transport protein
LSAGAQWVPLKNSRIDLGLAYLMFGNADINNDQSAAPNYQGRVTGSYEGNIYIVGMQYSQAF